jgi:AraC-like DNA-binding protein
VVPTLSSRPRLRLCRRDLPAALQPYVLEIAEAASTPRQGAVTLSATTESTLFVRVGAADASRGASAAVLSGPRPEATFVVPGDMGGGLTVRFAPVGAFALLGVRHAPDGRAGLARPLGTLVRPDLAEAVRRYGEAVPRVADPGWSPEAAFAARAALTVAFLAHRADDLTPGTDLLQAAVREIERRRGHLSIRALARTLGVGECTLRRRFGVMGMPAKRFAKIIQFESTRAYRHGVAGATWAETALRFGYADQSHFIHDHRRFAGMSPTRWRPDRQAADGPSDGGPHLL